MTDFASYVKDGDFLPVFPLPEFVLFPGVIAPLYIFEPRYRQMITQVMDGKGVFCLALLREGRGHISGAPDFWGMGCVCRLNDYELLPDGCYNIIVEGLARVRMKEVASQQLFRRARVTPSPLLDTPEIELPKQDRIRRLLKRLIDSAADVPTAFAEQVDDISLPLLLNLMAFHCPVPTEHKLKLLYSESHAQLCDRLLAYYKAVEF